MGFHRIRLINIGVMMLLLGTISCSSVDLEDSDLNSYETVSQVELGVVRLIAPELNRVPAMGESAGSSCQTYNGGCPSCSITCPVGKAARCYGGSVCYQTACACAQMPTCICQ